MPSPVLTSSKTSDRTIAIVSLLMIAVIAIIDWIVKIKASFLIFYLMPIVLITSRFGRVAGQVVVIVAIGLWLSQDLQDYQYVNAWYPAWNAFTRLMVFSTLVHYLAGKKRVEAELRQLTVTDTLTGIANRRAFELALEREIKRCERSKEQFAILLIDIDNLSTVNNWFGHKMGDRLLVEMSKVFTMSVRRVDTVARLSGDEFAILLPSIQAQSVASIIDRINSRSIAVVKELELPKSVGASIGHAIFSEPPASASEAIDRADAAMYEVKRERKGGRLR